MNPNNTLTHDLLRKVLEQSRDGYRVSPAITIALCETVIGCRRIIDNLTRERDLAQADLEHLRRSLVYSRL